MITGKPNIPPIKEPSNSLLSRRALAERWGCCIDTIKKREREGILRPIRFSSKLLRYQLSDILAIEALAGGVGQ